MSIGIKKLLTILLYSIIIGSIWGIIGSIHWMITDGSFKSAFLLILTVGLSITGAIMILLWSPLPNKQKTAVGKHLFQSIFSNEAEGQALYTQLWLSISSCLVVAGVIIGLFY